jgi:flagellar FliJ protein
MSQQQANPQRMQTLRNLHEQAQQEGHRVAVQLKRAQAEQAQAEAKLGQLQQFADQYLRQLSELERAGGAWSAVRDMRSFLERIAAAQAAQRTEIEAARARCAEQLRAWTAMRQKEKAFEVLLAQEQGLMLTQQRKRQQVDLQEWSLNRRDPFADSFTDSQNSRFGDTGTRRR